VQIKNVLLTGGCGLVGRTLGPLLRDRYTVAHFEMQDPGDGLRFIQGDLRNPGEVAKACVGMDAVIHVAALHGKAWAELGDDTGFEVNVTGTKNVLEGAARAGVKRVVFTSSIWANGHHAPPAAYLPMDEEMEREPAELYGLTKLLGEQMCRYSTAQHGISTIVLRPGGIRPAELHDPRSVALLTACVDVRDVAQAHALALGAPEAMRHEVFIITADSPLSRVDPSAFRADHVGTLDATCPGAGALVLSGDLAIGPDAEWYTIEKAKRLLGYRPRYNFGPIDA
jgi:UDP-glucose 4-epimerase